MSGYPPAFPLTPAEVASVVRDSRVSCHVGEAIEVVTTIPAEERRGCVVAIGAFDGVHAGHRRLIGACVSQAHAQGLASVVVTFDPDPSEVVSGEGAQERLLDVPDRVRICHALGVDVKLVLPFTHDLARQTPEEFIDLILERVGRIETIHVGRNFRFGHKGEGDVRVLQELGHSRGFTVVAHELLEDDGSTVSSTRIRSLLMRGRVEDASRLLGRCHYVRGQVRHGRGEGTSFGFPTANVHVDRHVCLPAEGVYACIVTDEETAWPSAVNVGAPPTFAAGEKTRLIEANLIGFDGDLYERELAVIFVAWLRASRPFSTLEELERMVLQNIAWVRDNIGSSGVEVSE